MDARELLQRFRRQRTAREVLEDFRNPGVLAASGTLQRDPSGKVVGNTFEAPARPPQATTGGQAFKRGILESVAGNIAGMPRMLLAGSGLLGPSAELPGNVPRILPQVDVPSVSGQQALAGVLGGVRSAGNLLQGQPPNLQQNVQGSLAQSQRLQQEHPVMSGIGGATGDALSILAGRAPFAKMEKAAKEAVEHAPGFKRFMQQVWQTPAVQKLARGAGKAGEAGLEGAALSLLQDGNPLETAAYAAGGQAAGSLALQLSDFTGAKDLARGEFLKGTGKLTLAATLTGTAMQFMDAAVPGGKDWILENLEKGFDHVLLAMIAGVGAGMAGAGRVKGENFPVIADAITALPRGALISLWEDFANDEDARKAVDLLSKAPGAHTESQLKALEKAMFGKGSFAEGVRHLLDTDETYREMWDAPDPRLAGVPLKEDEE